MAPSGGGDARCNGVKGDVVPEVVGDDEAEVATITPPTPPPPATVVESDGVGLAPFGVCKVTPEWLSPTQPAGLGVVASCSFCRCWFSWWCCCCWCWGEVGIARDE